MQFHVHARAIAALVNKAGAAAILAEAAKIPGPRGRKPPRPQVLSMWKRRGIPWNMREMFARLAAKHGVRLPRGFKNADNVY